MVVWPKGERAIVVVTNGDGGAEITTELTQAVAREYGWQGEERQVIEPKSLPPEQLQEVAGSYGHIVRVTVDDGVLHVAYAGATTELFPLDGDKFVALNGASIVAIDIKRGADWKIAALSALGQSFPRDP